jgi:hypothetical protein
MGSCHSKEGAYALGHAGFGLPYLPARRHSTRFSGSSAGRLLLYGSDMPIASIALAICIHNSTRARQSVSQLYPLLTIGSRI